MAKKFSFQKLGSSVKTFLKERWGTVVFFVIVAAFGLWGYFSVTHATASAVTYNTEYTAPEGNTDYSQEGTYVSIAKTDRLELLYNEAKGAIQVKNLKTGYVWKGIADNEVYDLSSVAGQWNAYLQSPIVITYNDLSKRDSSMVKQYAGRDALKLDYKLIDNGVAVTYGFTQPGIFITVEYTLEDDSLVVRLPVENIDEQYTFAVQTVEMLPMFGAAMNDVGGYLFYPDGSGAITTYERAPLRNSNVRTATFFTYSNRYLTFNNLFNSDSYDRYTASMPVYGIKNGDNAMFALFTKGAENSGVVVTPSGYVVDLNHIGFEIYTRNAYTVNLTSMSTSEGATVGNSTQRVDKTLIPEDREIRYFFLDGEEADYGGMANTYRNYLLENGLLNDALQGESDKMSLALNLLMGTTKEGMVFDEYITMTSFEQVQEIMDTLARSGVTSMEVVLTAWQKGYDQYEYWGPARQLGGTGGLNALNQYAEALEDSNIYLENGFSFGSSETKGINEEEDVVYDGLNLQVSAENMDGTVFYLMNPQASYKRNEAFLDKLDGYRSFGVAYDDVGRYAYADFNETAPFTKTQMVNKLMELLASTKNTGRKVAFSGSNQYVLQSSDYLYGLREDAYGLSITDYSVPFLEMVLSGLIPYSTEGAGNLSYDLQVQKLKWAEFGALPHFYLTHESALNLRDTGYDSLFSSTFEDWLGTVAETYAEFQDRLSVTYGQRMIDHTILSEDLIRVEYENGAVVYVNYGSEPARVEGVTVPAVDYLVVGGGEK